MVLSAKASKNYKFSQTTLARMTPDARAMLEDQQKAATVLVLFEDGKKLDTCAAIGPRRLSEYFELADGESLAPAPVQPSSSAPSAPTAGVVKPSADTPTLDMLSEDELKSALAGNGKDHYVQISDAGLMAAQGAFGTLPHITLFMPEAMIAIKKEQAKKQFLSYDPSDDDRKRQLTVFAQGYIGKTYQEGCASITRIVLLSSPSGEVVEEAYSSEVGTESLGQCVWSHKPMPMAQSKIFVNRCQKSQSSRQGWRILTLLCLREPTIRKRTRSSTNIRKSSR